MKTRILITGGTGSLGHALTERFTAKGAHVVIYSRDEKKQYDMKKLFPKCEYVVGDIRDYVSVRDAVRDVDIVVHGASLKYVNISELQPLEYVKTNVGGTIVLLDAILDEKTVKHCIGISTDKACLPVNTYGATKFLLEKLFLEAVDRQGENGKTVFNVARYGNVLGTRGSVVPFWQECRNEGRALPITNPDMTRFFFRIDEAVDLIEYGFTQRSGVIISKQMSACTLGELAEVMKGEEGTVVVGERPGEKHHEMLLSEDEMSRTTQFGDYFIYDPGASTPIPAPAYGSAAAPRLTSDEIRKYIDEWL